MLHGFGFFGVELFFVLSGFLIGRVLIRDLVYNNNFSSLFQFWRRRWYRTLPAYYLIWAILFIRSDYNINSLLHLAMLQNFFYEARDSFFGVSWSLAVEEWFYFIIPLLLYVLLKLRSYDRKKFIIGFCITGIIIATLLRFCAAFLFEQTWGDIRKSNFIRLDAFLFGILASVLQYYYPRLYDFIAKQKILITLVACGISLLFIKQFVNYSNLETTFNKTLLFTITDLMSVLVLIILESNELFHKWRNTWKQKLVFWVSVTSYSVYLIHWDIMLYFHSLLYNDSIQKAVIMLLICVAVTYLIAVCLYNFWEKVFLNLRDKKLFIWRYHALR